MYPFFLLSLELGLKQSPCPVALGANSYFKWVQISGIHSASKGQIIHCMTLWDAPVNYQGSESSLGKCLQAAAAIRTCDAWIIES